MSVRPQTLNMCASKDVEKPVESTTACIDKAAGLERHPAPPLMPHPLSSNLRMACGALMVIVMVLAVGVCVGEALLIANPDSMSGSTAVNGAIIGIVRIHCLDQPISCSVG